jgi:hypothetical protein
VTNFDTGPSRVLDAGGILAGVKYTMDNQAGDCGGVAEQPGGVGADPLDGLGLEARSQGRRRSQRSLTGNRQE